MINEYLATALIVVLVILWINIRWLKIDVRILNQSLENSFDNYKVLQNTITRLGRQLRGDGTYTYEDNCGNKYEDALEVTYNDFFLIIKRRSGSAAIPRDNSKGYTMTKNKYEEESN